MQYKIKNNDIWWWKHNDDLIDDLISNDKMIYSIEVNNKKTNKLHEFHVYEIPTNSFGEEVQAYKLTNFERCYVIFHSQESVASNGALAYDFLEYIPILFSTAHEARELIKEIHDKW